MIRKPVFETSRPRPYRMVALALVLALGALASAAWLDLRTSRAAHAAAVEPRAALPRAIADGAVGEGVVEARPDEVAEADLEAAPDALSGDAPSASNDAEAAPVPALAGAPAPVDGAGPDRLAECPAPALEAAQPGAGSEGANVAATEGAGASAAMRAGEDAIGGALDAPAAPAATPAPAATSEPAVAPAPAPAPASTERRTASF